MVNSYSLCARRLSLMRLLPLTVLCCVAFSNAAYARDAATELMLREIIEQGRFIQIPGPNPIITPGPKGAWDDLVVEAADAFEEEGTYYFYYHATDRRENSYELGVATAKSPLGPFKKHGDKPVLEVGPEGSWDEKHVACAMVVRAEDEEDDTYYMFYGGHNTELGVCQICLATSRDGQEFLRHRNAQGYSRVFVGPGEARDPMVLKVGELYHCYYTGHDTGERKPGKIYLETTGLPHD